jgi:hypothetical protein
LKKKLAAFMSAIMFFSFANLINANNETVTDVSETLNKNSVGAEEQSAADKKRKRILRYLSFAIPGVLLSGMFASYFCQKQTEPEVIMPEEEKEVTQTEKICDQKPHDLKKVKEENQVLEISTNICSKQPAFLKLANQKVMIVGNLCSNSHATFYSFNETSLKIFF